MPLLSDIVIKKPKMSVSNRSYLNMSSHAPDMIYPIFQQFYPAGSDVTLYIQNMVRTNPTHAPLFGRFRQDYHIFFCPFSLFSPQMRNNLSVMTANPTEDPSTFADLKFPTVNFRSSDSGAITPAVGSLIHYLDYGKQIYTISETDPATTYINRSECFPLYNYFAICYEYFANRNFGSMGYCNNASAVTTSFNVALAPLDTNTSAVGSHNRLTEYMNHLYNDNVTSAIDCANGKITSSSFGGRALWDGLFLRCLHGDMYNSFLNKSRVDAALSYSRMNVKDGAITFEQVRTSSALTKFFERLIAAGGRWSDWLKVTSGITTSVGLNRPEYIGSVGGYIDFDLVTATAATQFGSGATAETTRLGDLAGRGNAAINSRAHRIHTSEPGYIFVVYSIIPDIVYATTYHPNRRNQYLSDYYNPSLDRLGWQDVPNDWYNGRNNPNPTMFYGKQPAWTQQISEVDRSHGRLSDDLRYWTLSYTSPVDTAVPPVYSNPVSDQLIFDVPTVDNFFVMHSFGVKAKQPKSKFTLPKTL